MMAVFSVVFAAMAFVALAFLVLIFVDDWRDLQGRGEVADVPTTCACGRHDLLGNLLPDPDPFDQDAVPLTEAEQDEAICQAMEWQFPKTQPRRIR
jgi:hypothetical protein